MSVPVSARGSVRVAEHARQICARGSPNVREICACGSPNVREIWACALAHHAREGWRTRTAGESREHPRPSWRHTAYTTLQKRTCAAVGQLNGVREVDGGVVRPVIAEQLGVHVHRRDIIHDASNLERVLLQHVA